MKAVRFYLAQLPLTAQTVLVANDNSTVVSHISKEGGTRFLNLWLETHMLFQDVMSRKFSIRARHILGRLNMIADRLSCAGQVLPTEWSLHSEITKTLFKSLGHPNIDLFATRYNKCLVFVSTVPDELALDTEALSLDWTGIWAYASPRPPDHGSSTEDISGSPYCQLFLVALMWPKQPWFPLLQELAQSPPCQLPQWVKMLAQTFTIQIRPF